MRLVLAATALAVGTVVGAPGWAGAQELPDRADGVAVAVADEVDEVAVGDRLAYTVTLRNTSARTAARVRLELTLPVGVSGAEVHDGGESVEPWLAVWQPTVPAGGTVTVSATFVAGRPRAAAKGYTAQACLVHDNVRLACVADIDQLPGAADVHALGPVPAEPGVGWRTWLAVVLGAAVVSVAMATLLLRRRTDESPAPIDPPGGEVGD